MKTNPSFRIFKLSALGSLTTAIVLLAMPAPAHCENIFVTNFTGNTIGEYNATTGAAINASLISGLHGPQSVAVSGGHLFVANFNTGTIGEYTTSGATVNASLISGLNFPAAIAVSGGDLFVVNAGTSAGTGTIGHYTTSGATVNAHLISGLNSPSDLALSGGDLFVANFVNGTIGEYTTSGATVNAALVSGLNGPNGLTASGGHLFVANVGNGNNGAGTVGEYTTSGATVNASLVKGLNFPAGMAVSGGDLFVTNQGNGSPGAGTIGEYTTSGATVNASLISGLSQPLGITVTGQLTNVSTRASVGTGGNVTIAGFILTGTAVKQVVVRGLGPTLAQFGVSGVLADPTLQLVDSTGKTLFINDNWKETQQAGIQATGLAPPNDLESAIRIALQPGKYTAILSGTNNTTGVGLVEVYDIEPAVSTALTNVSTRGFVGTDQNAMIGGFITAEGNGNTEVVVRGLGPTLTQFGVAGALADPALTLVDSNGNIVQSNNNWKDTQQAAIQATGLAPPNDLEAAILATLAAGHYTVILSGNGGGTGIGLLEVYKL